MRNLLVFLCGSLLLSTSSSIPSANDSNNYCPNSENCPYGLATPEPLEKAICYNILVTLGAASSACSSFYGDSLDFTDTGDSYFGLGTTNKNLCDYYTSEDVVNDCLYTNGTLEINFCSPFFALAYFLRNNCSYLYTIDSCKIPYLGQLAINRRVDPSNCGVGPYIDPCQLQPAPEATECPNCIVASCPSS